MGIMVKQWMLSVVVDFIAENWSAFQYYCETRGDDADEIYNTLEKGSGR